jgi:hypothetical protein
VIERRLDVGIAAIDPGDPTVERVRVDVAREEQRHQQQQRVRAEHDDRDRPDRHLPAERFAQQQEESAGRQQGGHDPDREQWIALQAIEVESHGHVAEEPVGLSARRERRLVRGARGGGDDRHEQDAEAGEQERSRAHH